MMRQRGHNLSEERVAEIRQLSQDPNIYQKVGNYSKICLLDTALYKRPRLTLLDLWSLQLANAVAPSIWELDDVKKGVLCLMFGGTNKRVVPGTYHNRQVTVCV
jgi:DNA replicative helicase MCM subunit Mcm2 (Cdc46/Mcm family)